MRLQGFFCLGERRRILDSYASLKIRTRFADRIGSSTRSPRRRSIFPNNAETTRYLPKNWANIVFKSRQGPMALETKRAPEFRDNQQGSLGGAHHLRKRLQL